MANTLGGINLAAIAQESLDYLDIHPWFKPVSKIAWNDFQEDIANKGASVTTRVPSAMTAADLSSGYSGASADRTTTAKTVTLDTFYGTVSSFTDAEVSKAGDANWLMDVFVQPALTATVEKVMDDLLAQVTNANFSDTDIITAANFDADDLADKATALTDLSVPPMGRYAMLSPAYCASLQKDNAIQASYAYGGSEAIRDGQVPKVHGFDILEYPDIPANSENLTAFVGNRTALLLAARQPAIPADFKGQIENVTDPATGLPLQYRFWYSEDAGVYRFSIGVLYGVGVGNNAISRITSA